MRRIDRLPSSFEPSLFYPPGLIRFPRGSVVPDDAKRRLYVYVPRLAYSSHRQRAMTSVRVETASFICRVVNGGQPHF
eukprot:scaffold111319_cov17-Prasinocladus_malaysianus.AAC.1